jgi:hypothetical protein
MCPVANVLLVFTDYHWTTKLSSIVDTMPAVIHSIVSDIVRLGNSPIGDKTIPALRALHGRVSDFADSLAPKNQGVDAIEDFEDVINQLTETAADLDESCDAHEMAEDEEAQDEALESAGETLVDLANALQEVEPFAEYIETTEEIVATRWGRELARIASLEPIQSRNVLDDILSQARTPKESSTLLVLAREALLASGE